MNFGGRFWPAAIGQGGDWFVQGAAGTGAEFRSGCVVTEGGEAPPHKTLLFCFCFLA